MVTVHDPRLRKDGRAVSYRCMQGEALTNGHGSNTPCPTVEYSCFYEDVWRRRESVLGFPICVISRTS